MVDGLFLVLPRVAAPGLRQQRDLAELQARDDEERLAALAQHHGRLLGLAAGGAQRSLRLGRELVQPGAVACHGQARGQAVLQQGWEQALAVVGRQQALQQAGEHGLVGHFGGVALGLQAGERAAQAARHVQERGAEVLLARRVVPEHHGHALVGIRLALQLRQAQGLGHHGLGLRGNGHHLVVALARGGGHLDVGHARVLGLGQVEGHIHQGHAVRVGGPVGLAAAAVGHGLQHRNAQGAELAPPVLAVEHDLRGDEYIGQRCAAARRLQQPGEAGRVHHRRVERQRHGATGLDACDQVVDEGGLHRCDVLLVQRDADDGRALARRGTRGHAFPAQEVLRLGEHQAGRVRVVHRSLGEDDGRGQRRHGLAAQLRSQQGEEALEVLPPAVGVISHEAPPHGLGQAAAPGGLLVVQPGVRHLEPGQRARQVFAHGVL